MGKKIQNKDYLTWLLTVLLATLPIALTCHYLENQLPYQNSLHLETIWDRNDPTLEITINSPLRQKFELKKAGLDRIDVRLRKGAGEYAWHIKKAPLGKESIISGNFNGNDVQNYDFLQLNLDQTLDEYIGQELYLQIERLDAGREPGIAAFNTIENSEDIVFQTYYRN